MFNQLLDSILKDHPLLGLEKDNQRKGHLTGLSAPAWIHEGPIYELFVRNFSSEGTFEQVRDKIPYLKDLGVQTLWLMPVYPVGDIDRKGSLGSPYSISNYTSIDPAYGRKDDLKNLIQSVHQKGMNIILDIVANHMAVDNVWRDKFPEYFLKDIQGKFTRKISEWSDVIDLDYASRELRERMRQVITYWVEEFDFDGFRCDVAGLVPLDFWENVLNELVLIKKDIFLLAEWESSHLHVNAFHASYDWSTSLFLQDIYNGERPASDVVTWIVEKEANYPRNALPMRFTENHDLDRTRKTFGGQSFYPFVVFNFSVYGIPLIYCGQEFGLEKMPSLFDKDALNWEEFDEAIFDFYKNLIKLRKEYPALASRDLKNIWNDQASKVVSILKIEKDQKILVLINFSPEEITIKIDQTDIDHNIISCEDLFSGKTISLSELENFNINPFGFFIFKLEN